MKTKSSVKAGYSHRLQMEPVELPDWQTDTETESKDGFTVKTGQAVAAILE